MFNISDAHNDLLTSDVDIADYLIDCGKANVKALSLAYWNTENKLNTEQLQIIFDSVKKLRDSLTGTNIPALCFSIEDLGSIPDLRVSSLNKLSINSCTLTWNDDNSLAGGALGTGRLTAKGKNILKKMNERNIILDTAHLNKQSFFDCAENFDGVLINSHTCFNGCFQHPRNLDDEQIELIIERQGLIALTVVGDFLSGNKENTSDEVIRQIDYFVEKYGDNNLCLGLDFFGTQNLPVDIKNYKNLYILVEKMLKMGYNEIVIKAILCDNYYNFFF